MSKVWVRVVLTVLLVLTVASLAMAKQTQITFWAMNNAPSEVNIPWMEEMAREFEAETGIKVIFEEIGWDNAWQKITTAITTGEGAQVFQVGTTWTPFFAATGGLAEMNVKDYGGSKAFMEANYISTTLNGKCYGIPWIAETRALFYNTEMFEAAGVTPPQTWEELITVGHKITNVYGEGTAIAVAGTNAWDLIHNWAIMLWSRGGDMLNADNTEAIFNQTPGVQGMEYYVSLVKEGLAAKACAEYNQPQADSAFINGDVAMVFMGPWNISGIENDNPTLPYAIAEPPMGPNGRASFSGGSNLVVRSNAPKAEIDAAIKWVEFLMRKENLVDYTKNLSHMLPAKLDAFEDPYYNQGVWKVFKDTLSYATAYPPLVEWGTIEGIIDTNFKNILGEYINGDYDTAVVKKYMDSAVTEINHLLEK